MKTVWIAILMTWGGYDTGSSYAPAITTTQVATKADCLRVGNVFRSMREGNSARCIEVHEND